MALAIDDDFLPDAPSGCQLLPMGEPHLDAVHAIERVSQPTPWSRGMFADCLRAGYSGWVLLEEPPSARSPQVDAFAISSLAMDEAHLLNVAVAPLSRRRGWGGLLVRHVLRQAAAADARRVLLEVRASNQAALALYAELGFGVLARRRDYYPQPGGGREDALIMACELDAKASGHAP